MAVITAVTKVGDRLPLGRDFLQVYAVVVANAAAADEWFVTDFANITAVLGYATQGATTSTVNFVLNEGSGTAGTAGDNPGSLAIEASAAATVHVSVLGRI